MLYQNYITKEKGIVKTFEERNDTAGRSVHFLWEQSEIVPDVFN